MLKRLLGAILAIALIALVGCGEQKKQEEPSLLQDISGVWKENTSNSLMTLQYADKKVRMLVDDEFIPVNAGAIDNENHTANLNVVIAATGKPAVWTIRQIWNADKSAFHLQLTLHDGTQSEFSFVRKISTDDLNHIASLEAPVKSVNSAQAAAAAATQPAQTEQQATQQPAQEAPHAMQPEAQPVTVSAPATAPAVTPAPVMPVAATATAPAQTDSASAAQTTAFAPSFDCSKVTSGPERLICGSPQLSALDVELGQSYKRQMELTDNKKQLKADQIEWRKKERDACSTAECIAQAYRSRIDDLDAVSSHLSKPAEFK
ncbi:lysozyme inhibitor LprI family protein [Paraburkholderia sediminicola]|uniref:lysozyme inhibitor LprI family protein n=1 Tax=Paraburkholderia sediminicola TaxID=458836 RepID=UPI0038B7CB56